MNRSIENYSHILQQVSPSRWCPCPTSGGDEYQRCCDGRNHGRTMGWIQTCPRYRGWYLRVEDLGQDQWPSSSIAGSQSIENLCSQEVIHLFLVITESTHTHRSICLLVLLLLVLLHGLFSFLIDLHRTISLSPSPHYAIDSSRLQKSKSSHMNFPRLKLWYDPLVVFFLSKRNNSFLSSSPPRDHRSNPKPKPERTRRVRKNRTVSVYRIPTRNDLVLVRT